MGLFRLIELRDLLESHPENIKTGKTIGLGGKRLSYKRLMRTRGAKLEAAISLLVVRLIG